MRSGTTNKPNFKLHEYELPTNEKQSSGKKGNVHPHKAQANGAQIAANLLVPENAAIEADVTKKIKGINKVCSLDL